MNIRLSYFKFLENILIRRHKVKKSIHFYLKAKQWKHNVFQLFYEYQNQ